jgi:hypothetical protein
MPGPLVACSPSRWRLRLRAAYLRIRHPGHTVEVIPFVGDYALIMIERKR